MIYLNTTYFKVHSTITKFPTLEIPTEWYGGFTYDLYDILGGICLCCIVYPGSISMSDQSCFHVVDHYWNNVDPTLKKKQNQKSGFQSCVTLIQRRT